jgi:CheY-like chemotaxis protein
VTRTILLVEDDREILDMMDLLLRRLGYNPVLVGDVAEAIGQ